MYIMIYLQGHLQFMSIHGVYEPTNIALSAPPCKYRYSSHIFTRSPATIWFDLGLEITNQVMSMTSSQLCWSSKTVLVFFVSTDSAGATLTIDSVDISIAQPQNR